VALLIGLLATIVLAGCSGEDSGWRDAVDSVGGGSDAEQGAPATSADDAARAEGEFAEGDSAAGDAAEPATPAQGDADGRAVIRTGTMHIRATDTADVADQVVVVVETAGGYVSGTDLTRDADGVVAGTFTFRVPSAELQATMDAFDELADAVLERRLDEVDVTTQLTDLQAELTNLEAYETELRELLTVVRESGADTEDLLQVFDRLNSVRGQIDQVDARRTQLGDQVAMSTIHLRLSPTASTGPVTDPGWDPGGTARASLATTVRALTGLADSLIRIGLTVLPVTLVVAAPVLLAALLARRWWRRHHGTHADGSGTEPVIEPRPEPTTEPTGARTAGDTPEPNEVTTPEPTPPAPPER
jgi:hypothetical protein